MSPVQTESGIFRFADPDGMDTDEFAARDGQTIIVLEHIAGTSSGDSPYMRIRFPDGFEAVAFYDEVEKESRP